MTNIVDQIVEGATLMVTGMAIVFALLSLLVVLINAMVAFVHRYLPTPVAAERRPQAQAATNGANTAELAAISAAIHQHRNRHSKS
ncbi:MAG: OadG family protein [Gammaproteobacteria bacterium]|nr:OadG family protein [Gammaproteobacteria bacterium]